MAWNGTCIDDCWSILDKREDKGKNYCDYPCADDKHLYWTGDCRDSCRPELLSAKEGDKNFCRY